MMEICSRNAQDWADSNGKPHNHADQSSKVCEVWVSGVVTGEGHWGGMGGSTGYREEQRRNRVFGYSRQFSSNLPPKWRRFSNTATVTLLDDVVKTQ
jgi:hypothetical protein